MPNPKGRVAAAALRFPTRGRQHAGTGSVTRSGLARGPFGSAFGVEAGVGAPAAPPRSGPRPKDRLKKPAMAWIVPRDEVQERRPSGGSEPDQAATAGTLTVGLSVTHARVSSGMHRRATAYSSMLSSSSPWAAGG